MFVSLGRFLVFTLWVVAWSPAYGQDRLTFSIPGSVLLFGSSNFELRGLTDGSVHILKPLARQGAFSYPALAPEGSHVAWGFALRVAAPGERRHFALGVSPTTKQEWKTYGDFEDVGAAAFSPDGSKVAFAAVQSGRKSSFQVLNLSTGEMETFARLATAAKTAKLGWSPNGKQLVVELQKGDQDSEIAVADLSNDDVKIIGKGLDPNWSPTGEWIAYSDPSRQKCIIVHPDGSNARVVRDLGRNLLQYRMFAYGAVWSPDGKQLLLNEMKGEGSNLDVMLLDLASGKVTRKSKDSLPVFGWARRMP